MIVLVSCTVSHVVVVGMSEQQFLNEHKGAEQVETSAYRTVYKYPYYRSYKFYYFKEGKMYLMDEGLIPFGSTAQVASR